MLEFVPKSDETVSRMLISKKDIYENYNETYFEKKLSEHTKILKKSDTIFQSLVELFLSMKLYSLFGIVAFFPIWSFRANLDYF